LVDVMASGTPLGNYTLTVQKRGYRLNTSNLNTSNLSTSDLRVRIITASGEILPVEISSTHVIADVVVSLLSAARIVGSVLDSDGKPIAASVVLLRRRFNAIGVPNSCQCCLCLDQL
jgi:hypothetical protein